MKLRVLYLMTGLILIATLSLSAQTTEVKPADIKKKAIKKEKVTQPSTSDTKGTAVKTEVKQSAKSTEVKGTKSEKKKDAVEEFVLVEQDERKSHQLQEGVEKGTKFAKAM